MVGGNGNGGEMTCIHVSTSSGPIHRYIGNIDAFKIRYTYRYE